MDTERISALMNVLSEYPDHWIHSVLVIKEGKLVFEEYFQGGDLDLSDLDGGGLYGRRLRRREL